jgi:hypothetical protein
MVSRPGTLSVDGHRVTVGDLRLNLPFPVADALLVGDRIVVLYEYMSEPRSKQFRNVESFGLNGRRLWVAQHPTSASSDVYTQFVSPDPLQLSNFAGFLCELDPRTGRLLRADFNK